MEAADPTRLRRTAIGSDCKEDLSLSAGPENDPLHSATAELLQLLTPVPTPLRGRRYGNWPRPPPLQDQWYRRRVPCQ